MWYNRGMKQSVQKLNKAKKATNSPIVYQTKSGALELRGDVKKETIWASLDQIAQLFGRDKSVISRHIKSIFKEEELEPKATVAKNATVQIEGSRSVMRDIEFYNLDIIISVGYRVNSKVATEFRKWATRTLRGYLVDGYAIDRKRVAQNYQEFLSVVDSLKNLLPAESGVDASSALELIRAYAKSWVSLDAYDKQSLVTRGATRRSVQLTAERLQGALDQLRTELMVRGEATELFGSAKSPQSVQGIVGNVMQEFGGKPVYPSVEEKAAHLLYFMVKNHPFTDFAKGGIVKR